MEGDTSLKSLSRATACTLKAAGNPSSLASSKPAPRLNAFGPTRHFLMMSAISSPATFFTRSRYLGCDRSSRRTCFGSLRLGSRMRLRGIQYAISRRSRPSAYKSWLLLNLLRSLSCWTEGCLYIWRKTSSDSSCTRSSLPIEQNFPKPEMKGSEKSKFPDSCRSKKLIMVDYRLISSQPAACRRSTVSAIRYMSVVRSASDASMRFPSLALWLMMP